MTPEEFFVRMKEIVERDAKEGDHEMTHIARDEVMERVLTELGYGEGLKLFDRVTMWFA